METVLKLTRESSQSVKLAYFCGAYVLAAILLIPETFLSVFNQYPVLRFYVFIPPLMFIGLISAALVNQLALAPLLHPRQAGGQGMRRLLDHPLC